MFYKINAVFGQRLFIKFLHQILARCPSAEFNVGWRSKTMISLAKTAELAENDALTNWSWYQTGLGNRQIEF